MEHRHTETRFSPVVVVQVDRGMRCGIVTCQTCGAAVLIDQRRSGKSSTLIHAEFHEAREDERAGVQDQNEVVAEMAKGVEANRSDIASLGEAVTLGVREAEIAAAAALQENTASLAENSETVARNTESRIRREIQEGVEAAGETDR